jgi:hypothetical protein
MPIGRGDAPQNDEGSAPVPRLAAGLPFLSPLRRRLRLHMRVSVALGFLSSLSPTCSDVSVIPGRGSSRSRKKQLPCLATPPKGEGLAMIRRQSFPRRRPTREACSDSGKSDHPCPSPRGVARELSPQFPTAGGAGLAGTAAGRRANVVGDREPANRTRERPGDGSSGLGKASC